MNNKYRQKAPSIDTIKVLPIPDCLVSELENGLKVYYLPEENNDTFKIDIYLETSIESLKSSILAKALINLITEGTRQKSSEEINSDLDFYGCFFEKDVNFNYSKLSVYGIVSNFEKIFNLLIEILSECNCSVFELNNYQSRSKQRLKLDLEKNNIIASREFNKLFYDENHPLNKQTSIEDYDSLNISQINTYYSSLLKKAVKAVVLTGNIKDDMFQYVLKEFSKTSYGLLKATDSLQNLSKVKNIQKFIQKNGSVQDSIIIGFKTINKNHNDYVSLQVLTTLLGGYFGSRLMKSIREEKGLTYGISANVQTIGSDGVFTIRTDVIGNSHAETLSQIKKEIDILKNKKVSFEELNMVKNYMSGNLARLFDGTFTQSDRLNNIIIDKKGWSYYTEMLEKINSQTEKTILETAIQYLNIEDSIEIVVGNKN